MADDLLADVPYHRRALRVARWSAVGFLCFVLATLAFSTLSPEVAPGVLVMAAIDLALLYLLMRRLTWRERWRELCKGIGYIISSRRRLSSSYSSSAAFSAPRSTYKPPLHTATPPYTPPSRPACPIGTLRRLVTEGRRYVPAYLRPSVCQCPMHRATNAAARYYGWKGEANLTRDVREHGGS